VYVVDRATCNASCSKIMFECASSYSRGPAVVDVEPAERRANGGRVNG
jgi:hypothetical protein